MENPLPDDALPIPTDAAPLAERPLTPRVRRQLWAEPSVRGWWLTAVLVSALVAWLILEQVILSRTSAFRAEHWRRVTATIEKIEAGARGEFSTRATYTVTAEELPGKEVVLKYFDDAGKGAGHELAGYLTSQTKPIHPQQQIEILVDPERPDHWTDRTRPGPIIAQLLVPLIPAPLPFILFAVALWQRRRLRQVYLTGVARTATVVGTTRSAVAPRFSIVRCIVKDFRDKRVFKIALPRAATPPLQPGDLIPVLTPSNTLTPALAATLYDNQQPTTDN